MFISFNRKRISAIKSKCVAQKRANPLLVLIPTRVFLLSFIGSVIFFAQSALAATINVPADYATIQAAVAAAISGDTINVAAGHYHESQIEVWLNKGFTLQGAGASVTTIDGDNAAAVNLGNGVHPGTIYVKNPDTSVKIDGFTFINPVTTSGEITSIAIAFGAGSPTPPLITISNNHFIGVSTDSNNLSDNAIWVYAAPAGVVSHIENNEFENQWQSILLELPKGGAVITGNNFHDLFTSGGNPSQAMSLWQYDGTNVTAPVTISTNTFSASDGWSIVLRGSGNSQFINNVTIANNTMTGTGTSSAGIVLRNPATTLGDTALSGIVGATISGNTITSSVAGAGIGIWLRGPNNNATITGGSITGFANGILSELYNFTNASSGVVVHENSLTGNTVAVSNTAVGAPSIDAMNNWWGNATGPTHASNPPGTGDAISDNTPFIPWYIDVAKTTLNTAPAFTDATLKASSTVKGQTLIGLGTPGATIGAAVAGTVTINGTQAADTSNAGSYITLFDKNYAGAVRKVVKYATGGDTSVFAGDTAYANEAITNQDFFIVKVTAADTTTILYYKVVVTVDIIAPTVACNDGVDNDLNTLTDFIGGDPGCESATDLTEATVVTPGGGGGGGGGANVVSNSNTSTSLVPSTIETVTGDQTYSRPVLIDPSLITLNAENNTKTAEVTSNGTLTLRPNTKSTTSLTIPPNTSVTGTSDWSGQIDPPVIKSLNMISADGETITGTTDKLQRGDVVVLVKVGSDSSTLTFSKEVSIEIPVDLPDGTEVKIYSSGDGNTWMVQGTGVVMNGKLVIKTNHLTYFAVVKTGKTVAVTGVAKTVASLFRDIANHWGKAYIEQLFALGVVKGKSAIRFGPDDMITRAELVKIAILTFKLPVPDRVIRKPFADVALSDWHVSYVQAAKDANMLSGSFGTRFHPDVPVSRIEALKIILSAAKAQLDSADIVTYSDTESVSWYMKYLAFATSNGIVSGYPDATFRPANPVTRAEAAKIAILTLGLKK